MNFCLRPFLSFLLLLAATAPAATTRPNFIFILTDDQGYGDLSAHGNPVLRTPHLDHLRERSVRFTNFSVSPTCAPTRSALLTGRHEFRNGVTHTILERERLTLDAITLPQVLQTAGYATGIFGKWHLGDEDAYQPGKRGFSEVYIHGGGGIGQTFPGSCGDAPGNTYFSPAIRHNGTFEKTTVFCTDAFFTAAGDWIHAQRNPQPFFCWISPNAPHAPYTAQPADRALYEGKGLGADTENFFGMIHNIDENIGKLLANLEKWGLAQNTVIVAMNDNGGTAGVKVFNANMRGAKVTPWLGGTRAFSFWCWPGKFTPADCPALTAHVDVFRTIAKLAAAPLSAAAETQIEGRDLTPLLANPAAPWPDRTLVTHVGRWPQGSDPNAAKYRQCSIRNSRYTLVNMDESPTPHWQLYDVLADPAQQQNLAADHPAEVQRLSTAYDAWWTSVQPQLVNEHATGPQINPFQAAYYQQYGGSPTPSALQAMDPARATKAKAAPHSN